MEIPSYRFFIQLFLIKWIQQYELVNEKRVYAVRQPRSLHTRHVGFLTSSFDVDYDDVDIQWLLGPNSF